MTTQTEAQRLAALIQGRPDNAIIYGDAAAAELRRLEADFSQLMQKHNALHINARAGRDRIAELEAENARMRSELDRPMSSEATVLVHDNARLRAEVQALRGAVPNPMSSAPKDASIIRLLVRFNEGSFEDDGEPCWTIGTNHFSDTGIDEWLFAGWNWTHDCFTQGAGTPIGWLPMLAAAPQPAAQTNKKFTEAEVKAAFMAGFDAPETMHPTAVINDAEECWSEFWKTTTPSAQGDSQ
jgi:hypothetical protein